MPVYQCRSCGKCAAVQPQPSLNGRASILQIECRTAGCENQWMTVLTSSTPDPENDAYIARYYVVHDDVAPERRIVSQLSVMRDKVDDLGFYASQLNDAKLCIEIGNLDEQISRALTEARRVYENNQNGAQNA